MNCGHCGKSISPQAKACPECGHPNLKAADKVQRSNVFAGLLVCIGFMWLASMCSQSDPPKVIAESPEKSPISEIEPTAVLSQVQAQAPAPKPIAPKKSRVNPEGSLPEELWLKYNSKDREVPIERQAVLQYSTDEFLSSIDTFVRLVKYNGYRCETVSAASYTIFSKGFEITCNNFTYKYTAHDDGRDWIVTSH